MRKPALAGLFAYAIIVGISPQVGAESTSKLTVDRPNSKQDTSLFQEFISSEIDLQPAGVLQKSIEISSEQKNQEKKPEPKPETKPKKKETPKPVVHVVEKNESLSKIAKRYETTWQRIFYKNTSIANPDKLVTGQKITIPTPSEKLQKRTIQVTTPKVVTRKSTPPTTVSKPASTSGSSSGNTYTYGYCTWYVKNQRPDLPNNLGDANTWVSRARAQGMATGSKPVAGAVGQRGNHVVYIERVNSNGTVFISEMNRTGWNVKSTRTVPASYFTYIY
jgi:surface antigen